MRLWHQILCNLLLRRTQKRLSFWFGDCRRKSPILWFTEFESNLLLSHVFLFHCVVCNVFILFGPSTRLTSLVCKMSSLWITVTVTMPCTSLRATTLMGSCMLATTFRPLGVHYDKRQMRSFTPCSKMTITLLTLPAKCSMCRMGTISWWLGGGTLISITHWTKIGTSLLTILSWN